MSRQRDATVAVVGAGPVGMTLALRLAQRGVAVTLLEAEPTPVRIGSKAICMQRETLEIWARAGIGAEVARRGVQWRVGRTYLGDRELFSVTLPGAVGGGFPPFVNISQSEVEDMLAAQCAAVGVEVRHGWRLTGLAQDAEGVDATFDTDAGARTLRTAWMAGADGAHSGVRHALGLPFRGYSFEDRFLICDVRAELPFPNERRFFFDPPWNPGRQVLIHPQPDGVWRIDWQVPADVDLDREREGGRLDDRIRAVIGATTPYELVWATSYRFSQRIVDRFRVGRVFLAGDAAHLMSPFGARGLNAGAADAENLAWKLALVASGQAPDPLLETYDAERRPVAVENLAVTDATMRFMVPHGPWRRAWRNIILRLSPHLAAARRRVNSGRLAEPARYDRSPIVAPGPGDPTLPRHGTVAPDVALGTTRLREVLDGRLTVLVVGTEPPAVDAARTAAYPLPVSVVALDDPGGELRAIYAPSGPRAWVVRPDAHLAAGTPLDTIADALRLPALVRSAITPGVDGAVRTP